MRAVPSMTANRELPKQIKEVEHGASFLKPPKPPQTP